MANFGKLAKQYRNLNSFTQAEIAETCNVARNVISMWEKGDRTPTKEQFELLCEILGTDFKKNLTYQIEIRLIDYTPYEILKISNYVERMRR